MGLDGPDSSNANETNMCGPIRASLYCIMSITDQPVCVFGIMSYECAGAFRTKAAKPKQISADEGSLDSVFVPTRSPEESGLSLMLDPRTCTRHHRPGNAPQHFPETSLPLSPLPVAKARLVSKLEASLNGWMRFGLL